MLAGEAILLLFLPAISGFAPGFLFSDESAYDYGAQAAGGFEYREIACRIYASTVRRSRWDVPYNGHAFTSTTRITSDFSIDVSTLSF